MNEVEIRELKRTIVGASYQVKEGHLASAFSILDIMYVLLHDVMQIDLSNPDSLENDQMVVSKGHAAIGIYAALAERGFFSLDELNTFGKWESRLGGHPDRNKVPGVCISTGSLGHGLPNALGVAYGVKLRNLKSKIYTILGDGEINEGSVWESVLLAPQFHLDNLCCIIDNNHSIERAVNLGNIASKFAAFGWTVSEVDGHDHTALKRVLSKTTAQPHAVIASTIKGQGCSLMEGNPPLWHHKSPTDAEYAVIMEELSK